MTTPFRWVVLVSVIAALAVFLAVQDRVTARGARRYIDLQRSAIAGRTSPVTIDEIMRPAVDRSVSQGLLWGSVALVTGLGTAVVVGKVSQRRGSEHRIPHSG